MCRAMEEMRNETAHEKAVQIKLYPLSRTF